MKKTSFLTAALVGAALISGNLYAQVGKARSDLAINKTILRPDTASSDASVARAAAVSTISLRAIKDFRSRFTNVTEEKWSRIDGGFLAFCIKDGFQVRSYYNRGGSWQASVKCCDESQLPFFIRDVVKRTYYDLAITVVNIVEVPEHKAYVVHLEDKKTLKIVRVNEDGDMDVLNDFTKSN